MQTTKKESSKDSGVRKLKVCRYSTVYKSEETSFTQSTVTNHPYIRLRGQWLKKAGFNIDDAIVVTTKEGEMVIRREE